MWCVYFLYPTVFFKKEGAVSDWEEFPSPLSYNSK